MSLGQRSRSQTALKVCAFQIHVRPITSSCMMGFENYLAQILIKTRQYIAFKNNATSLKVKVTAGTFRLCILKSCPTQNFIRHGGICKLFGGNDHHDQAMCCTYSLCIGISCSVHNFIRHGGFENYLAQMIIKTKQSVLCKNHVVTSKIKSTAHTYRFCIGLSKICSSSSCPAHNFVVGPASGMVRYRDLAFHPFVGPIKALSYSRASVSYGHISFLF